MKAITILHIVLAALMAILGQPSTVDACSCAGFTPCESFGSASAVFIGRAISGSETKMGKNAADEATPLFSGLVQFTVEETFKGVTAPEIEMTVGIGCDPLWFVRGEPYLVYAYSKENSREVFTGSCSRTGRLSRAKDDLDFLRSLPAAGTGGRLYGSIEVDKGERESTPLADVTIVVESATGQHQQVKTDRNGKYELQHLIPGNYTVTPILPDNYAPANQYHSSAKVVVADRACAQATFSVLITGRVSGRVLDPYGANAPAYVHLISADTPERSLSSHTQEDGHFEIEGVGPGRYLLHIELKHSLEEERYFYPGVEKREDARIVVIGMGQDIKGLDLSLQVDYRVKHLEGFVRYPDGRTVAGAEVRLIPQSHKTASLYYVDHFPVTLTNGRGWFSLPGYSNVKYEILAFDNAALASGENRLPGRSEPVVITLNNDTPSLDVIVPLVKPGESQDAKQKKSP